LTATVFGLLSVAFIKIINFYPVPAWDLFSERVGLWEGRTYYILRGETQSGRVIDIPAARITDGLTGRNHMMLYYVMGNLSFEIASPHPANVALMAALGGRAGLPRAARVSELLRSWGTAYNARRSPDSPERLHAMILVEYRWPGQRYADYAHVQRQWKIEL
jgi:hypothetical protein